MLSKPKEIFITTPKHKLKLELYSDFIKIDKVKTDKEKFTEMCKKGCKNYNNKYSCPPNSPNFKSYVKDANYLFVVLLKIDLNQLAGKYKEYHKLRIGNAVIKPRIEKIMRNLEKEYNTKFLSTGACRLCKPCNKKKGLLCKHPKEMRFSLESLGVDCNALVKDLFDFPLLWYKEQKCPEYTSVVCALPLKEKIIGVKKDDFE